jgi:hypothetical protein
LFFGVLRRRLSFNSLYRLLRIVLVSKISRVVIVNISSIYLDINGTYVLIIFWFWISKIAKDRLAK